MTVKSNSIKQNKKAVITIGRYQPPTLGHIKLINNMIKNNLDKIPVVCIVKGKKSSSNKLKNPYDFKIQKSLLEKSLNKDILIIPVSSGYLGDIIDTIRNDTKLEPDILCVGKDREDTFKKAINRYKDIFQCDMKLMPLNRYDNISASDVRQSILDNDFNNFKKMTINLNFNDFNELRHILINKIK